MLECLVSAQEKHGNKKTATLFILSTFHRKIYYCGINSCDTITNLKVASNDLTGVKGAVVPCSTPVPLTDRWYNQTGFAVQAHGTNIPIHARYPLGQKANDKKMSFYSGNHIHQQRNCLI